MLNAIFLKLIEIASGFFRNDEFLTEDERQMDENKQKTAKNEGENSDSGEFDMCYDEIEKLIECKKVQDKIYGELKGVKGSNKNEKRKKILMVWKSRLMWAMIENLPHRVSVKCDVTVF